MMATYPYFPNATYWLQFAGAFLIVVGLLMAYVGIREFLEWRKGRQ